MRMPKGFTLPELLMVVTIVGLLAAIVVPQFVGAHTQARTLICTNHLRRISETSQTWATNNRSWCLEPLASGGWPGIVVNLTGTDECLRCPEGGELKEGTPVEQQLVIRTSPNGDVAIPLVGLLEGGGFKVLKLSQTQWDSGIAECARYQPVPYVPDSNPNVYWWGYDDGAIGTGDYDFQDAAIRVEKRGDGTAKIKVIGETAGKPEIWSADLTTCYAAWDEFNGWQASHGSGRGGTSKEFELSVGGASHYGMNVARLDMRRADKIQALDYLAATAYSTDDWTNPDWDQDEDGRPDFLRHGGRLNVLYLGGSVKTVFRQDVDPVDVNVEREFWQP